MYSNVDTLSRRATPAVESHEKQSCRTATTSMVSELVSLLALRLAREMEMRRRTESIAKSGRLAPK